MRQLSRDPFARTELHSERVEVHPDASCDWCGALKLIHKRSNRLADTGKRYLYRYEIQHDGGRTEHVKGKFCSVGCMRSYHA